MTGYLLCALSCAVSAAVGYGMCYRLMSWRTQTLEELIEQKDKIIAMTQTYAERLRNNKFPAVRKLVDRWN